MSEVLWAIGRGTGLVSLAVLTVTLVIGAIARSGRRVLGVERFAWQLVHRDAALFSCALVAIHVFSLLFDPYAKLVFSDLVVPFQAGSNPVWVGLGTIGVDLIIVVTLTGLLRDRIGPRVFHAVHYATYPLWAIALLHGIGSGSDMGSGLALGVTALFAVVTVGLLVAINAKRLAQGFVQRKAMRG